MYTVKYRYKYKYKYTYKYKYICPKTTPQKPKPTKIRDVSVKKWVSETSGPFFGRVTQVISSTNLILGAPRCGGFSSWARSLNALFSLRFNTRATKYLAKNGWHAFFHWYDYMSLFAEIGVVWRWLFNDISVPRTHRYILWHAGTKHLKACALPIYNMNQHDRSW